MRTNINSVLLILTLILFSINRIESQTIIDPREIINKKAENKIVKNKVKKETMYKYEVESSGELSKKGELRCRETYNLKGKVIEEASFFPNMTIKNVYEYDINGKTTKMISYDVSNKIRETIIWEYDESGNQIRNLFYNSNGNLSSTRENNDKIEGNFKISYNSKGEISSKTESIYDTVKKISIDRLLTPNGDLRYENKYFLNEKLQIKEWRVIDNVQNKKFIVKYTYDKNDNEIESIKTDFKNNRINKITYKYDQNNLKTEEVLEESDKPKLVFKYEYEYF